MRFDYGLDDVPPLRVHLLLGLQWAFLAMSTIVILGKIVGSIQPGGDDQETLYLQKLFFLTGAVLLAQLRWGHRFPLVSGPAAVLLIGVVSSRGTPLPAASTSMFLGGALLVLLAMTGLLGYVRKLFTARVVAVVLLLIVFTLAPTIRDLIIGQPGGVGPLGNIAFAVVLVFATFSLERFLPGAWRSGALFFAIAGGSAGYFALFPPTFPGEALARSPWLSNFVSDLTVRPVIVPGVLVSFLICYLALAVNDIGSIQALNEMLDPAHKDRRINRGLLWTGLANMASGVFGVLGPVNYSLSPGVLASTRSASRRPLILAGVCVLALSPFPRLIGLMGCVPSVVVGGVLAAIMASQFSAGLSLALKGEPGEGISFRGGVIIGLPVLLGNIIAFLPADVVSSAPEPLRPIVGNGFVVGVAVVLLLEHVLGRGDDAAG